MLEHRTRAVQAMNSNRQSSLNEFESSGPACPTCDRDDFASTRGMRMHHAKTHGESIAGTRFECDWCGESARKKPNHYATDTNHFCSPDCQKAHKQSTDARVATDCDWCGDTLRVYSWRVETRDNIYCNRDCRGAALSERQRGDANPAWAGGNPTWGTDVRYHLGPASWHSIAKRERERAEYRCEKCGEHRPPESDQRALEVHHLIPLSAGGTNRAWNLMALCAACHRRADSFVSDYVDAVLIP